MWLTGFASTAIEAMGAYALMEIGPCIKTLATIGTRVLPLTESLICTGYRQSTCIYIASACH